MKKILYSLTIFISLFIFTQNVEASFSGTHCIYNGKINDEDIKIEIKNGKDEVNNGSDIKIIKINDNYYYDGVKKKRIRPMEASRQYLLFFSRKF